MKKVLIITFFFPPNPAVASRRLEGLTKYLNHYGWEPIVLTPRLPTRMASQCHVIQTDYPGDVTLLLRKRLGLDIDKPLEHGLGLPASVRETNQLWLINILGFFYGLLTFPEEQRTWYKDGLRSAVEFIKNNKIDCVLSSSGPVVCHKIAKKLKDRFSIPWVADFRDLWSQNHYYLYGPIFRFWDTLSEINTLHGCDSLITVSQPLVQVLANRYRKKSVHSIPNGFDPEILNPMDTALCQDFNITYTGHIYPGKRDPSMLLETLRNLIDRQQIDPKDIKVRFLGLGKQYFLGQEIKKFSLENIVALEDAVTFQQSIRIQRQSQILLLLSWTNPKEKGVYTGKVFEYLAAKRPILALGGPSDGVIPELMQTTKAGTHINDRNTLEQYLIASYREYKETGAVKYHGIESEIVKYSHIEMARKFANVLNLVTSKPVS